MTRYATGNLYPSWIQLALPPKNNLTTFEDAFSPVDSCSIDLAGESGAGSYTQDAVVAFRDVFIANLA
jgi:hypothetical protein